MRREPTRSGLTTTNIVLVILAIIGGLVLLRMLGGLFGLVVIIAIAAVAGMIAERLLGSDFSLVTGTLLGLVGGIVGNILLSVIGLRGLTNIPLLGPIIAAVIGAVVLVWVVRFFFKSDFGK